MVGFIIAMIFGIILMIKAFQTSVLWGLGYIFVPFVSLIFVIKYWEICKKPFFRIVLAIPLMVVGAAVMPKDKLMKEIESGQTTIPGIEQPAASPVAN